MNDFTVHLPPEERATLRKLIATGSAPARKLLYARILLKADRSQPGKPLSDPAIAVALETSRNTVARIRQKYGEHGLETALARRPTRRVYPRKLDGAGEAHLVALACSPPPEGRTRWTLQLLADRLIAFHVVDTICDQTVRRTLKKTHSNRG
jgi:nucleotide-binding universal stress UspA family protein